MAPVDVMPLDEVIKNNNGTERDGILSDPAGTSRRAAAESARNRIDLNQYATKKTIAQGMLDIALLTANAAQLKYVLLSEGDHSFYTAMLVLISLSIVLQVLAGIGQLILISINLNTTHRHKFADTLNNVVTAVVFVITVINVIISAFGLESGPNVPLPKPEIVQETPT